MKQQTNFTTYIFRKNKKLKISTLSPNRCFYFKIKSPNDLYWGLYVSPIAFFDIAGDLIYYNHAGGAELTEYDKSSWNLVSWSSSGDLAFFY